MSQPLDREQLHRRRGRVDLRAGEIWAENPFQLPAQRENLSAYERNQVFLNRGHAEFLNASFASDADIDSDSRSVCIGDFDRDGSPDMLVGSSGGGPLRLFLNRAQGENRSVQLALRGSSSNRSAIGARVTLRYLDRTIVRDLFAANGHKGQSAAELLVGMRGAKRIESLVVRWPDGTEQTFTDLPVGGRLEIEQGRDGVTERPFRPE